MSIKNTIKKGNATYEVKYAGVWIGEPASYQRMLFRKYDETGKLIVERELFFRCNVGLLHRNLTKNSRLIKARRPRL